MNRWLSSEKWKNETRRIMEESFNNFSNILFIETTHCHDIEAFTKFRNRMEDNNRTILIPLKMQFTNFIR